MPKLTAMIRPGSRSTLRSTDRRRRARLQHRESGLSLYEKIIVGYDGREGGEDALELGRLLADVSGARLVLAHAFPYELPLTPGFDERERERAGAIERALADVATDAEAKIVAPTSSAARGLHEIAEQEGADLVVIGSSHRGPVGRVLAGSVTERLLHGASCAVAVAPRGFRERRAAIKVIGACFDGSRESKVALAAAAELAQAAGAAMRVLAVVDRGIFWGYGDVPAAYDRETLLDLEQQRLERAVEEVVKALPSGLRAEGELLHGPAGKTLATRAENGIDLLVAGSRGYGPAQRVLLGSVSTTLARSAPCPLVVAPRSSE